MPVFQYDPPERFVAGTVGQPGERTFFLQAAGGGRITSVVLEKAQVAALAERIEELLDEVRQRFGEQAGDVVTPDAVDDAPLEQPIEEDFRVGTLALAWDAEAARVIIEAQQVEEPGADEELAGEEIEVFAEEAPPTRDVLRVHLTPGAARAFADRAMRVVAAGRPNCPLCGQPLDPGGHVCPRQNGYKPHVF
ncbi:DUF3090 domain-containing protein [Marinitenerispora sediminis]|uniref:DUF3090 domain-containing protein n=1 Tax=Marinitenerispora sediminis TaxID=1931232 RepID=A0A368T9B2_9ACTN|nr:DUF3090 domain-containing protein [Marinitenerispora sediminis]RCV52421.1 DUF3090 domain-containing protein [Marinitenerispora sediminis]RCV60619.1 DUF3090 domain-containing protein [Marinitenerispora sediminis]RCV61092.1 DUF3090 domain-containing protein [Marinitenerispora sediminis]